MTRWKIADGKFLIKETLGWQFNFFTFAVIQCVYGTLMVLDITSFPSGL